MALRVANRYARALAEVVGGSGDFPRALDELGAFQAVWQESAPLREVMEAPSLSTPQKMRVLDEVAQRLRLSLPISNFLRVLLKNYRLAALDEIAESFRRLAYARLGRVQAQVFSAAELSDAERQALAARFRQLTGKEVELEFHLEPSLVAGIKVQVGSTVYDGSVRGTLDRFREQLTAG